jgi:hypothetical protein
LFWQVVPTALGQMMKAADATKTNRLMAALMKMKKLDVAELQKGLRGEVKRRVNRPVCARQRG